MNSRTWVAALLAAVSLCGCYEAYSKEDSGTGMTQPDSHIPDLMPVDMWGDACPYPPDSTTACGSCLYPCGPYGKAVGDVIENFTFEGLRDPKEHCKSHASKKLDTSPVTISMRDWYLGDPSPGCKQFRRKVLWIAFVVGWCSGCASEMKAIQSKITGDIIREQVGLLLAVSDNKAKEKADVAFLKTLASDLGLTMALVADPDRKIRTLFAFCSSLPMNLVVDLKTMKIVYADCGYKTTAIDNAINKVLGY